MQNLGLVVFLGWLLPGFGHILAGERGKGALFAILLIPMFLVGLFMHGGFAPVPQDVISRVCAYVRMGCGLNFLAMVLEKMGKLPTVDPRAFFYEIGSAFTTIVGALNVLLLVNLIEKEEKQ